MLYYEFITLVNSGGDIVAMAKAFASNDLEPDHGFAQLLQGNFHLVDEVSAGFSALCLAIIRSRRGAGSDQLVCNVVASLAIRQIRQGLYSIDDVDRKINQSFFEYLRCHNRPIRNQQSTISNRQSEAATKTSETSKWAAA